MNYRPIIKTGRRSEIVTPGQRHFRHLSWKLNYISAMATACIIDSVQQWKPISVTIAFQSDNWVWQMLFIEKQTTKKESKPLPWKTYSLLSLPGRKRKNTFAPIRSDFHLKPLHAIEFELFLVQSHWFVWTPHIPTLISNRNQRKLVKFIFKVLRDKIKSTLLKTTPCSVHFANCKHHVAADKQTVLE